MPRRAASQDTPLTLNPAAFLQHGHSATGFLCCRHGPESSAPGPRKAPCSQAGGCFWKMWARAVRRGVPETKEHLGGRRGRAPHAPAALSRWPSPHTRQARRGAGWGLGLPGCESPSMQLTLPRLLQVQELGVPRRDCSRNGKNVQRHFWHFKGHRLAPSGCGLKPPHVHCLSFRAGLVRALVGRHVRSQQGLTLSARPSPRGTESWRPAPCALQCGVCAADTPEAAHPRAGAGRRIGPEHSRAGEARGGGPTD